jgi:hypothetical protein
MSSSASTTQKMTRPLLLVAAIVVVSAFSLWGTTRGVAALVGASLAVGNWFALRWLAARLVGAGSRGAALGLLLMAKIGLLMAIVFVLINRVQLDPVGLAFGLSVLFVGPVLASLLTAGAHAAPSLDPSAARSAREER